MQIIRPDFLAYSHGSVSIHQTDHVTKRRHCINFVSVHFLHIMFQICGRLAIEMVFPQCAEIRLPDRELAQNKKAISSVMTGEASRCQTGIGVVTGSRAEGFAMEPGWGHEEPDKDVMIIYGGSHTVSAEGNRANGNPFRLTLNTDKCYPAYYRVKVDLFPTDAPQSLVECIQKVVPCVMHFLTGYKMFILLALFANGLDYYYQRYHFSLTPIILTWLYQMPNITFSRKLCFACFQMCISLHIHRYFISILMCLLVIPYIRMPCITCVMLVMDFLRWITLRLHVAIDSLHQGFSFILWSNVCDACLEWLQLTDLPRIMYVLSSASLIAFGLDVTEHLLTSKLYSIMTSSTSCFPGVLNWWLAYITRDKTRWLSSVKSMQKRREVDLLNGPLSGPSQSYQGYDSVPALMCSAPFEISSAISRIKRTIRWPAKKRQVLISNIPGVLVAVGHSHSPNYDIEWRASWSIHELLLAETIPAWAKQGFRAFKYTVKANLINQRAAQDNTNGRGLVGSYHMKTVFFAYLQNHKTRRDECPYKLFLSLLHKLEHHLMTGNLSHFFVPQCNLFQTTLRKELDLALQCVKRILSNPVTAILQSPLRQHSHELFGGWMSWVCWNRSNQEILPELLHKMQIGKISNTDCCLLLKCIQKIDLHRLGKMIVLSHSDVWCGKSNRYELKRLETMLLGEIYFHPVICVAVIVYVVGLCYCGYHMINWYMLFQLAASHTSRFADLVTSAFLIYDQGSFAVPYITPSIR